MEKYSTDQEPDWTDSDKTTDLRKVAAELSILPMLLDWTGACGIKPNGEVVWFNYEKPYEIKNETNIRITNIVLFKGVKRYCELTELIPKRSSDSVECSSCQGTGIEPMNAKLGFFEERIVCFCGGLGWIPQNENKL